MRGKGGSGGGREFDNHGRTGDVEKRKKAKVGSYKRRITLGKGNNVKRKKERRVKGRADLGEVVREIGSAS